MKWSWRLGRVFGIDVFVHATFLVLVAMSSTRARFALAHRDRASRTSLTACACWSSPDCCSSICTVSPARSSVNARPPTAWW